MTTHFNIYDFCDCLHDVFFGPVESLMCRDHTGMPARAGMGSLQRVHGHGPSSTFLFFFLQEKHFGFSVPSFNKLTVSLRDLPTAMYSGFPLPKGDSNQIHRFSFYSL